MVKCAQMDEFTHFVTESFELSIENILDQLNIKWGTNPIEVSRLVVEDHPFSSAVWKGISPNFENHHLLEWKRCKRTQWSSEWWQKTSISSKKKKKNSRSPENSLVFPKICGPPKVSYIDLWCFFGVLYMKPKIDVPIKSLGLSWIFFPLRSIHWYRWCFLKWGVPLAIIHFCRILPYKPTSYWGSPMTMETPI